MYRETADKKIDELCLGDKDITILGIETSCDETAAAVVKNGRQILSNIISTQIPIHRRFGGVVPEVASRNHVLAINGVIDEALAAAGIGLSDVDAIAVTYGAGLIGALLVGVSAAKALAMALDKPLIKVNHIQSHIFAVLLSYKDLSPPFLSLVASGGHTVIIKVESYNDFSVIGSTLDDAIGEAFDKVARILGLPYPGGPSVDDMAQKGQASINFFKHYKKADKDYKLSYSGLKTAVINYVHNLKQSGKAIPVEDICASFTKNAVDILVDTVILAAVNEKSEVVTLSGGVASNTYLRKKMEQECGKKNIRICYPPPVLCTDNAAMVASRGYYSLIEKKNIAGLELAASSSVKPGD